MPDDRSEAEAIWRQYYGDPDGLAARLIQICLTRLGVVWKVFEILDDESDFGVGCRFYKKVDNATLQKLLETNEGIYFCKQLYSLLESRATFTFPINSCSTTYSERLLFKTLVDGAKVKPNDTSQPRKLSDAEIAAYKKKARKGATFNEDIVWEIPQSGTGFVTYNRNDVAADGLDEIGTKETIEAIIRLAREWAAYPPNKNARLLQIGDISRPGGLDTSQHQGHEDGKIFDVRPLRNDGATGKGANLNYNSPSYDQDLTKEFIRFTKKLYPNIFIRFNDGAIAGKGEFTYVHKDGGGGTVHNDHLHLEFR